MNIPCRGSGQRPLPQAAELRGWGDCPRCSTSQRLGEDRLIARHTAQITAGQWRILDAVRRRGRRRALPNKAPRD
jgi:hypothetical protein